MRKTTQFKDLVLDPEILVMPVAHDALCARIAERTGFKAICCAGYASSASLLGMPDVELLTLTEMVDCAWRIADAVDIPVFVDGDDGHGNVNNVARTVRLMEKAGAAGLFIEDQVAPKRCGHMEGKQVIPAEEMIAKIHAAVDARVDPDLVIMARTDALASLGIDEAIRRGNLYHEAGADLIFIEAPRTVEEMRRITTEVKAPTLANNLEGGKSPLLNAKELQEIGYSVVAYPVASTYAIARAVQDLFEEMMRTGTSAGFLDRMITFERFNEIVGLPQVRAFEKKHAPPVVAGRS